MCRLVAYTAEQYQQHQEQLALMQKQQLEQVKLQQTTTSTAANPQVSLHDCTSTAGLFCPAFHSFLFFLKQNWQ